jgi:SAM-dependent methyltransferase
MSQRRELDTVGRFSDRAADYVKFRPTYPAAAVDAILEGLGPVGRLVAADVGAGTGISARLLAARGVSVVAVEPGGAMRMAATPHPKVVWVAGKAEATGLRSHSVDLVTCAQAFHWFQPAAALTEFARILKPGQRLAIMWNRRSTSDPLTVGYQQALVDVGSDVAVENTFFDGAVISEGGRFSVPVRTIYPNPQRLDLGGLIGRARSASYVPKSGAAGALLIDLLRDLHERYADASGFVTFVYETEVFRSSSV